jgi:hypothetical protein
MTILCSAEKCFAIAGFVATRHVCGGKWRRHRVRQPKKRSRQLESQPLLCRSLVVREICGYLTMTIFLTWEFPPWVIR